MEIVFGHSLFLLQRLIIDVILIIFTCLELEDARFICIPLFFFLSTTINICTCNLTYCIMYFSEF